MWAWNIYYYFSANPQPPSPDPVPHEPGCPTRGLIAGGNHTAEIVGFYPQIIQTRLPHPWLYHGWEPATAEILGFYPQIIIPTRLPHPWLFSRVGTTTAELIGFPPH